LPEFSLQRYYKSFGNFATVLEENCNMAVETKKIRVVRTVAALKELTLEYRNSGKRIGFVPTMGALHSGHMSLISRAKNNSDVVICSVFVNPTQFNDKNDLLNYPRHDERDIEMLENHGCDVVFMPGVDEMYPNTLESEMFSLGSVMELWEGAFRPGHYNGVLTIVKRLFEYVQADVAFFGKKDFQQLAVIRAWVNQSGFPIEIVGCETIRSEEGIALSSRNERLTREEFERALSISRALYFVKDNLEEGKLVYPLLLEASEKFLLPTQIETQYFVLADASTLEKQDVFDSKKSLVVLFAGYVGAIRLIDELEL
jgi:pantoate--beta-alanine ligase